MVGVATAHERILRRVAAAAKADPGAGHAVSTEGSVLALLPATDALVTDVSSVGLDFLYLRTDAPLLVTDRRDDRAALAVDAPITAAADVVDSSTVGALGETVAARLADDVLRPERERMRRLYFGDLAPGESTRRFLDAIGEVIAERDRLLGRLPRAHVDAAGAAAVAVAT